MCNKLSPRAWIYRSSFPPRGLDASKTARICHRRCRWSRFSHFLQPNPYLRRCPCPSPAFSIAVAASSSPSFFSTSSLCRPKSPSTPPRHLRLVPPRAIRLALNDAATSVIHHPRYHPLENGWDSDEAYEYALVISTADLSPWASAFFGSGFVRREEFTHGEWPKGNGKTSWPDDNDFFVEKMSNNLADWIIFFFLPSFSYEKLANYFSKQNRVCAPIISHAGFAGTKLLLPTVW